MGSHLSGSSPVSHSGGRERGSLRDRLVEAYVVGNELLILEATTSTPSEQTPLRQAEVSLHRLIDDGITGFGRRSLSEALKGYDSLPGTERIPQLDLGLPLYDDDGNPMGYPGGFPQNLRGSIRLPLTFIAEELFRNNCKPSADLLIAHSTQSLPLTKEQAKGLTGLVANRMFRQFDQGKEQNWLLAERAIQEAFKGPAFRLPGIS